MPLITLCTKVEKLASRVQNLELTGYGSSAHTVCLRMELAALSVELEYADLIEKIRK